MKLLLLGAFMLISSYNGIGQDKAIKKAQKYIENGNPKKALTYAQKAVEHNETKSDGTAWIVYGQVHSEMVEGNAASGKTARMAFSKAKQLGLNDKQMIQCEELEAALAMRCYLSATKAFEQKQYSKSIPYFEIYRDVYPHDTSGFYNVAVASYYAKDFDLAVENYKALFNMGLNSSKLYQNIIDASTRKETPGTETRVWLDEAMHRYPDEMELWKKLEFNYKIQSQTGKELIATLYDWFDGDTTNAELNFDLGTVYYNLNDTAKAIFYYRKSIALDSNYASPVYNLGTIYYNQATEYYDAANMLPIGNVNEYNDLQNKGLACLNRALPYFERTVKIDPNEADAWKGLSQIYRLLGRFDEMKHARSQYNTLSGQ